MPNGGDFLKFLPYEILSGKDNMARDEALLEEAIKLGGEPVLRLYGWSEPTLSFGKNQEIFYHEKFPSVRRITGGRTLLHHKELTYCFVCHQGFLQNGQNVQKSFLEISKALMEGLLGLGIKTDFAPSQKLSVKSGYCMNLATGADLSHNGQKLIGSAQARKRGYILQHGAILLDFDPVLLEKIFGEPVQNITSIAHIAPDLATPEIVGNAIQSGFEKVFGVK